MPLLQLHPFSSSNFPPLCCNLSSSNKQTKKSLSSTTCDLPSSQFPFRAKSPREQFYLISPAPCLSFSPLPLHHGYSLLKVTSDRYVIIPNGRSSVLKTHRGNNFFRTLDHSLLFKIFLSWSFYNIDSLVVLQKPNPASVP